MWKGERVAGDKFVSLLLPRPGGLTRVSFQRGAVAELELR